MFSSWRQRFESLDKFRHAILRSVDAQVLLLPNPTAEQAIPHKLIGLYAKIRFWGIQISTLLSYSVFKFQVQCLQLSIMLYHFHNFISAPIPGIRSNWFHIFDFSPGWLVLSKFLGRATSKFDRHQMCMKCRDVTFLRCIIWFRL
jgi:hypothetical protein